MDSRICWGYGCALDQKSQALLRIRLAAELAEMVSARSFAKAWSLSWEKAGGVEDSARALSSPAFHLLVEPAGP